MLSADARVPEGIPKEPKAVLTPWYQEPLVALFNGNCLDVMAQMPERSVQACITSPPYYALRDYKIPAQIWRGAEGCEHLWGDPIHGKSQSGSLNGSTLDGAKPGMERRPQWTSASCERCHAWLGSLGNESTPFCQAAMLGQDCTDQCYLGHLLQVCEGIWRVLRDDGCFFINLGDSYAQAKGHGHWESRNGKGDEHAQKATKQWANRGAEDIGLKPKNLLNLPARFSIAMQSRGWILRNDMIWAKKNCMPESVRDRATRAHEYIFHFTKSPRYFWDAEAVAEPLEDYGQRGTESAYEHVPNGGNNNGLGKLAQRIREARLNGDRTLTRNLRTVLHLATEPTPEAHFATYPTKLIEPLIKASTSERGCCPACQAPWARVVDKQSSKVLGQAIRVLREKMGWSREQLARATRKGVNNVWDWEVGGHIPSGKHWDVLGTVLNLPFSRSEFIEQAEYIVTGSQRGPKQVAAHEHMGVNRPYSERKLRIHAVETKWQPTCTCHEHTTPEGWRASHWPLPEPQTCVVLDPFAGSGTSLLVARTLGRKSIGIELSESYVQLAMKRLRQQVLPFADAAPVVTTNGHEGAQQELSFDEP